MPVPLIRRDKNLTGRQKVDIARHTGMPSRRVVGGWIGDLIALRKSITLCQHSCARRFKREDYVKAMRPPFNRGVIGDCDGCNERNAQCDLLLPIEVARHV